MRIPTSVIVMSLLTAAPFGLAIRDTLTKKEPVIEEDEYGYRRDARRDREALEEYEREMQREAEERARKREVKLAMLDDLFGQRPASMGKLFDGITLGADAGSFQSDEARERIYRASRDGFVSVSFNADSKTLRSVLVSIEGADYDSDLDTMIDPCDKLRARLTAAWGPSNNGSWLDPSTHQRAHMDTTDCTLTFDRYLDVADWMKAIGTDAVGQKMGKFLADVEARGADLDTDDETAFWVVPGLSAGSRETNVYAYFKGGKVVGVRASTDVDFDTAVAVRDALTAKLKKEPTRDDDYDSYEWKKKATLVMPDDSGRINLLVGDDPWD